MPSQIFDVCTDAAYLTYEHKSNLSSNCNRNGRTCSFSSTGSSSVVSKVRPEFLNIEEAGYGLAPDWTQNSFLTKDLQLVDIWYNAYIQG
jgi:hypothetical protein